MRWGLRLPLFWPGIAAVLFFFVLVLLQGLGLSLGSTGSLFAGWLTCAGLTLAWGYLMAGASAGGWPARLAVTLGFLFTLYPVYQPLLTGFSGLILLLGMIIFLVWRWRRPEPMPEADVLVPAVIIFLIYGVVAERSAMIAEAQGIKEELFPLFLQGQLAFLFVFAGALLMFIGAALADAGLRATRWLTPRLSGLPAGLLAAGCVGVGGLKLLWDLTRTPGTSWITGILLAAAAWGWFRVAAPAGHWSARRPGVVLGLSLAYTLVSQLTPFLFDAATTVQQHFTAAIQLTMLAALITGGVALALGRRPLAFLAGLVGIYLVFAGSDGVTASPIPVLSLLHFIPKLETGVTDGLIHLALLGWAAWFWVRGERDARPYALILSVIAIFLGVSVVDGIYDSPALRSSPLSLLIFVAAAAYCLWQVFLGAGQQKERAAATWAGLGIGGALLLFAAAYWSQNSADLRTLYDHGGLPPLGYAIFMTAVYGTGLLRYVQTLSAEGRAAA